MTKLFFSLCLYLTSHFFANYSPIVLSQLNCTRFDKHKLRIKLRVTQRQAGLIIIKIMHFWPRRNLGNWSVKKFITLNLGPNIWCSFGEGRGFSESSEFWYWILWQQQNIRPLTIVRWLNYSHHQCCNAGEDTLKLCCVLPSTSVLTCDPDITLRVTYIKCTLLPHSLIPPTSHFMYMYIAHMCSMAWRLPTSGNNGWSTIKGQARQSNTCCRLIYPQLTLLTGLTGQQTSILKSKLQVKDAYCSRILHT